jgi:predicted Zn-dependent protease
MDPKSVFLRAAAAIVFAAAGTAQAASMFDRLLDSRNLDIAKDLGTAAAGVNEKDEIAIGRDLAGQTLGAANLVNDPAVQRYVNRVGRWIASQSERPDLPWRFAVINTASINAFAAPGGYVLVTRGLYDVLDDESQLAGILGHEIGHVVAKHHIAAMQQGGLLSAGSKAVEAHTSIGRSAAGGLAAPQVAEVFARGLDKSSEYEADRMGVVLAARAGYDPNGLVEALKKLRARGASDSALQLLYSTHPLPGDRLAELGKTRLSALPQGQVPAITAISAAAGPAPATTTAAPAGARAFSAENEPAPSRPSSSGGGSSSGGSGLPDPTQLLRGIFGR